VIFVTVGTQFPFDRLVAAVDAWAASQPTPVEVQAQVGAGRVDFGHLRCVRSLDAKAYTDLLDRTRLIVAHAGIGSILSAVERGIPIIVLPRDHKLGEHRDDHQQQTARQFERMGLVTVAWGESDLPSLIEREFATPPSTRQPRRRSTELVDYLRGWLHQTLDR
jgi:UDP-N-acetylglucosamine transferase subunit ALG13